MAIYAMIRWFAIIGQGVIRLLLNLGLYLAGEELGKLLTTIHLNMFSKYFVLFGYTAKYKIDDFKPSKRRASCARLFYNVRQ